MTTYDNKCTVTCTDNGKVAEAEVDRIEPKDYLKIFMAGNNIHMKWNGRVFVGNAFGFEFTTPGPRQFNNAIRRGF